MKFFILISLIAVIQAFKINAEDSKNIQMLSQIKEASLTGKSTAEEKAEAAAKKKRRLRKSK